MTWTFEDFVVGRTVVTPCRRVTSADVQLFAELTGDHHPLHVDPAFAAGTEFGQPIAHGLLGLGLAVGLLAAVGVVGPSVLALLGVERWRFLAPVPHGSALSSRATVAAVRPSASRPMAGIVTLAVEVLLEDRSVAQHGNVTLLVRRATGAGGEA